MGVDVKEYKKTASIHAIQWENTFASTSEICEWAEAYGVIIELQGDYTDPNAPIPKLRIPTLEGPMFALVGDFIAKGVNNEFWAIKPDIMAKTYEEV
jgi:hypothetical protein